MKEIKNIAIGEEYHIKLEHEGAFAELLRSDGNTLIVALENMNEREKWALKKGVVKCGVLSKNGAMLLLWQFYDKSDKLCLSFDSPFDARLIPDLVLHDIDSTEKRLSINVDLIDLSTSKIVGMRVITMSNDLTVEFLSAVQDQLSNEEKGIEQLIEWRLIYPERLALTSNMHKMGAEEREQSMKILVKYKEMSFLIDEKGDSELLSKSLPKIYALFEAREKCVKNMITVSQEDIKKADDIRDELKEFINGAKVIGYPFDNHDALLYALDRKLDYKTLELHGNTSRTNAKKEKTKDSQIYIRVSSEKKSAYVKQAQRKNLKLTQWIERELDRSLDTDLLERFGISE